MKEKDYVERMKSESAELSERIKKISSFVTSDKFKELSEQQQNLLRAQKLVMESYLCILTERIRVES